MAPSNPPSSPRGGPGRIHGCAVWFIAAAPIVFGLLLGYFVGVLAGAPLGGLAAAAAGGALGLVAGVVSFRYGRRVLREAGLYYAEQSRRRSAATLGQEGREEGRREG